MDSNNLKQYLTMLEANNFETIIRTELYRKVASGVPVRIYTGFEVSGQLHIGHLPPLLILATFTKLRSAEVYALFSEFHTLCNGKSPNYSLVKTIEKIPLFKDIKTLYSSSERVSNKHPLDNYMNHSTYRELCFRYSNELKIKHLIKSASFFQRTNYEELNVNTFLYPLYQAADMSYLNIDVAVGGSDQRKIHMLHSDRFKEITSYIHVPILTDSKGEKISKSGKNTLINIDTHFSKKFYTLPVEIQKNLEHSLMVATNYQYELPRLLELLTPNG